ncbi:hypothetical protein Bca4012_085755 [Brassica carinata]
MVTYLTKFFKRYGKTKLERAIELFEHAVSMMLSVRTLYIQYAKLEEDYVLTKQAMKVYEEATKQFPERQRLEMCEIYSMLILQQRYLVIVQYTSMSLTMLLQGPAQNSVQRGKEDTYREMLRSKRSVFAGYSQMWRRQNKAGLPEDEMAALERQLMSPMSIIVTSKDGARQLGFVSRWQGMWKVLSFLKSVMMSLLEKTKYRSLIKKSIMLCLEELPERERKNAKKLKKALKMVAKALGALERTKRHKLAQ